MRLVRSPARLARLSRRWQRQGRRVGLVPTMGALHAGHASLIRAAAAENDVSIVTIFVNPLQFGPREDFRRYPRTLGRDLRVCRRAGASVVFAPAAKALYPTGFQTAVEVPVLARRWEGARRPGHFRGVATVVALLFELVRPAAAYFGQKDYQQARVVAQLIRDLRLPIRLRVAPTVREPDGLAMSSRNAYLTPAQRAQAAALSRALASGRALIRAGERRASAVERRMRQVIRRHPGVRADYLAAADAQTLEPLRRLRGRVVLLGAARVGSTRLIDNLLVDVP